MTTIFGDGFETGDFSVWSGFGRNSAQPVIQSVIKHNGVYAMKSNFGGHAVYEYIDNDPCFVRLYIYLTGTILYGNAELIKLYPMSYDGTNVNVILDTSRVLKLITTSGIYSSGQTLALNTWYCIEVLRQMGAGNGVAKLWLDGVLVVDKTTETISGNSYEIDVGLNGGGECYDMFIDDVVIADAYIGPEGPSQQFTLSYQSNPIAVPCTVNGQTVNPGTSLQVPSGTSVTISVPIEVTV